MESLHCVTTENGPWPFGLAVSIPFIFSALLLLKSIYRLFFHPLSKFPGPKMAAITKLYESYHHTYKGDWPENLARLHATYGDLIRIGPNELHCMDHEWILKHHRRPDMKKCTNYYGTLNHLIGGLHQPQAHNERKSLIQPLFAGKSLASYAEVLNHYLDLLHERFVAEMGKNDKVNTTHIIWAYTTDIMVSYIIGKETEYLKSDDLESVHHATRAFSATDLATTMRTMPPVNRTFKLIPSLRSYSPLGWLDEIMRTNIRGTAPETEKTRRDTSVLARMYGQLGDEKLTVEEAAQAVFIGNESLLSNLTFLLHFLIHSPDCVKKLRQELDTLELGLFGHRVWRDPRVLQLPYLDAVCRESTRLSAPGWHRQPRQIDEPLEWRGSVIPAMTSVSFTLSFMGSDPNMHQEAHKFDPERWLGKDPRVQQTKRSAAPFGTGTRTCLGQHIANQVLRKTVAAMIYNFDMSLWNSQQDETEGYRYLDTYPQKGREGILYLRVMNRFREV
ncbi:cytochrome P450 [Stachybotrys elegans]|uniref:Cytochrome P450 n=1 Tax=Stachybotrys elegans TaxID=80388 RepID=A0A8K0SIN1_9HYPO|nr:cytochrome P450 [Stachybotrys elegans]